MNLLPPPQPSYSNSPASTAMSMAIQKLSPAEQATVFYAASQTAGGKPVVDRALWFARAGGVAGGLLLGYLACKFLGRRF